MLRAIRASARRGWDAVGRFFRSIYVVLERLTRPVVQQGGQTLSPAPEGTVTTTSAGSTNLQIAWQYTRWLANGTYFVLDLLLGPLIRTCIPVFTLLGKHFIVSLRAVFIFLSYLVQYIDFTGKDKFHEWTLLTDLTNMHWDWPYFFSILRHPSLGLRDYRRWRSKRGLRWAKPKVKVVDVEERDHEERWELEDRNWEIVRRRGGPLLGQDNPFDYVSDDECAWEGDGKKEKVLGEAEHREAEADTEQNREPVKRVSIGRKETRRGAKKRKGKR